MVPALAFYQGKECGEGNDSGISATEAPVLIVILDQNTLQGLHIINLEKFNLDIKWQSFRAFDVLAAQAPDGILKQFAGQDLSGAILINQNGQGVTYNQPLMGGITHIDSQEADALRGSADIKNYIRGMTELQLQKSRNPPGLGIAEVPGAIDENPEPVVDQQSLSLVGANVPQTAVLGTAGTSGDIQTSRRGPTLTTGTSASDLLDPVRKAQIVLSYFSAPDRGTWLAPYYKAAIDADREFKYAKLVHQTRGFPDFGNTGSIPPRRDVDPRPYIRREGGEFSAPRMQPVLMNTNGGPPRQPMRNTEFGIGRLNPLDPNLLRQGSRSYWETAMDPSDDARPEDSRSFLGSLINSQRAAARGQYVDESGIAAEIEEEDLSEGGSRELQPGPDIDPNVIMAIDFHLGNSDLFDMDVSNFELDRGRINDMREQAGFERLDLDTNRRDDSADLGDFGTSQTAANQNLDDSLDLDVESESTRPKRQKPN
ncbi:hypothetical protein DRE_02618 [Drechslerella stenobrocha 248]|uniref:Uncharacterized protein n=1 Tax=Drechslerella stenobrocha 248 TaxID=1043628 RepID=W7HWW6_9PEZI|nr:hypothetical protein DRE_02618 [Drechslerella stenobrocha 248]